MDARADASTDTTDWRAVLEAMGDAIVVADLQTGLVVDCNPAACRLFGTERAALLGRHFTTLHPAEEEAANRQNFAEAGGGVAPLIPTVVLGADGRAIPVEIHASRVLVNGLPRAMAVFRDLRDRVAAQQALAEREAMLAAMLDRAPVLMALIDGDLRVRRLSRAARPACANPVGQRPGMILDCIHRLDNPAGCGYGPACVDCPLRCLAQVSFADGQERYRQEMDLVLTGDRPLAALVSTSPFELGGERLVVLTIEDVSALKERERALQEANRALERARDQAESATRAKSEFLGMMSHELRTPMNAVVGCADLLLAGGLSGRSRELTTTLRQSADHLLQLIRDLLDFSRIEARSLTLDEVDCDLPALLTEISRPLAERARAKGLTFPCDLDPALPRWIHTDPTRLRQILVNLLDNALKFTQRGRVRLAAEAAGHDAGRLACRFTVEDSGIGIDPAYQARLFQAFEQGDRSTSRRFGGSGLGLAICKRLCALMGGDIVATSAAGAGARFTVTLAFAPAGSAPNAVALAAEAMKTTATGPQVPIALLIEDDEVNRIVTGHMLEHLGWRTVVAANAREALALLCGQTVDLILLDYHLPDMDGFQLARCLRGGSAGPAACQTPVLTLTADISAADPGRLDAAGIDGLLAKPVGLEQLGQALRRWGPSSGARHAVPDSGTIDLDYGDLLARMDGSAALAGRVLAAFETCLDHRLERLRETLAAGDTLATREAAHTLAGSAANASARRLAGLARRLEQTPEGDPAPGAGIEGLVEAAGAFRAALRNQTEGGGR